jgi:uncharacterized membrane protein
MPTITETKVLDHDVHTVYNQWTQFEEFPRFMQGVERVDQLDDRRLHWVADFGGSKHEWDAEITEQVPDKTIAWRSLGGVTHNGRVTFEPLAPDQTRAKVEMEWEPEGLAEKAGAAVGLDERSVSKDLDRFKEFIEARGVETGAWRGRV